MFKDSYLKNMAVSLLSTIFTIVVLLLVGYLSTLYLGKDNELEKEIETIVEHEIEQAVTIEKA